MLNQLYTDAKESMANAVNYCVVGQWASSLTDNDKDAFTNSLNDADFSSRTLHALYKSAGATFGLTSLLSHRNGECGCR
jgi:hypothetical protein